MQFLKGPKLGLVIVLGLITLSLMLHTATAQQEDFQTGQSEETYTVDAPLVGWYLIPLLGAMRRRRHDLQDRNYDTSTETSNSFIETSSTVVE